MNVFKIISLRKSASWTTLFIFPVLILTACASGKSVQNQIKSIQSELYYELTTPVYSDSIRGTIYLNLIEDSVSFLSTSVARKGGKMIPLLFYNLSQHKYDVTLGNGSFIQPYHEFLADAIFAECNRSTCFDLKKNDNSVSQDSVLILDIKINNNLTQAKMINKDVAFLNPLHEGFFQGYTHWEVNNPVSILEISVRLSKQGKNLWENTYNIMHDCPFKRKGIENPVVAYETCIDNMTQCLSLTTKELVEKISRNLHLFMLYGQFNFKAQIKPNLKPHDKISM